MNPTRRPRPPSGSGLRVRPASRIALLLAAGAAACFPGGDRAAGGEDPSSGDPGDGVHPRAAYLTSLTFVGFEDTPSLVHLRLENRADRNRLALSYQGWVAGSSAWSPLLAIEDTIPVARAAWRVVPTSGMRLRVGRGARIEGVRLPVDGTPLRLEAIDLISTWSSATGQREALRSAELRLGQGAEAGLLLQRRLARPLDTDRGTIPSQAFVLTDTLGSGLIILRNRLVPDAPATVWAWLDGARIEWDDALLLALSAPEESPGRWSLQIGDEGVVVELEAAPPVLETSSSSAARYRLYPVRATLSVGEQRRTLSGLGVEDDGP